MSHRTVVMLTRDGIEQRHVARALAQQFPALRVIVEAGFRRGRRAALRRAWRAGGGRFISKLARGLYHKVNGDAAARRRDMIRLLGEPALARDLYDGAAIVAAVNDSDCVAQLRQWRPALALVYGCSVVRSPVFEALDCPILNLHTGLSPWYRGFDSHLWALVDNRPDRIGVTVHDCTPDIDGGSILATRLVTPEPGDSIHAVFARQVLAGAPLYAQCAAAELDTPMARSPQDLTLGREYRWKEMGLWAELAARRRLRRLAAAGPRRS